MGDKLLITPVLPGVVGAQAEWKDIDDVLGTAPGAWTSLTGDLTAALQAFSGFPPEYRVVGDKVELRGIVEVITGTQSFPFTLFLNFPAAGGGIPAGLEPGAGSHIVPALFSNDTFTTSFPGSISVNNKVSVGGTGGTGVATAWDVVVLDGISWSVTA